MTFHSRPDGIDILHKLLHFHSNNVFVLEIQFPIQLRRDDLSSFSQLYLSVSNPILTNQYLPPQVLSFVTYEVGEMHNVFDISAALHGECEKPARLKIAAADTKKPLCISPTSYVTNISAHEEV